MALGKSHPIIQSEFEQFTVVTNRIEKYQTINISEGNKATSHTYRYRALSKKRDTSIAMRISKGLHMVLEYNNTPALLAKIVIESLKRDSWALEISNLKLPELVQQ